MTVLQISKEENHSIKMNMIIAQLLVPYMHSIVGYTRCLSNTPTESTQTTPSQEVKPHKWITNNGLMSLMDWNSDQP